jgi:hypothetical protein
MALFRIHTARKVFDTNYYAQYHACFVSGVIESNGKYLPVKYIEVLQSDGTYRKEYPRD